MSIRSVDSLALAFSATPLPTDGQTDRRTSRATAVGLSFLSTGDRDLVAAMFGPQALATVYDPDGAPAEAAHFVGLLVGDRRSGALPAGLEVTSTYLQGVWDQYPSFAGRGAVARPMTRKNLVDGLFFLGRRSQGGLVDVRA